MAISERDVEWIAAQTKAGTGKRSAATAAVLSISGDKSGACSTGLRLAVSWGQRTGLAADCRTTASPPDSGTRRRS